MGALMGASALKCWLETWAAERQLPVTSASGVELSEVTRFAVRLPPVLLALPQRR